MDIEKRITELNLADILPNRFQPRIKFSEEAINELSESIKEHGVIQPIVVRAIGDKYEIIAGERRYKASVLAGKNSIPAIITDLNDKDSAEVALIENVQRQDLTPIEEAISYKKILDMGFTQEQLASKLGNKQSTIANKLRLLNLHEDVQEALLEGKISERHARSILRLNKSSQQIEILNKIIDNRLTVRKTDDEIDKILNQNDVVSSDEVEVLDVSAFEQPTEENTFSPTVDSILGIRPIEERNNSMNNNIEQPTVDIFNTPSNLNLPTSSIIDDKVEESVNLPSSPIINENIEESINLPSTPIVEQPEEKVEETKSEEPIFIEEQIDNEINPGFMNIEKIATEAKNINEDKPLADVNSLLEPDSAFAAQNNNNNNNNNVGFDFEVEQPENILTPGKFFDILNEEPETEPAESVNNDSPIIETPLPSDVPFQPAEALVQPLEQAQPVEVPVQPIDIPMQPKEQDQPQITTEVETLNPIFNNPFEPIASTTDEAIEPVNNINQDIEEEKIVEPILQEGKVLKDAIDIIRECGTKVEGIGFDVEIEEIDFEDIYQVIFKIKK
ncbi:MAG: ParB/RepB/Spo0J family partition protein [Bacilli bacterium]|nr:ParB/RepB/Spo0J family partition protein [Bacilli bacterium]